MKIIHPFIFLLLFIGSSQLYGQGKETSTGSPANEEGLNQPQELISNYKAQSLDAYSVKNWDAYVFAQVEIAKTYAALTPSHQSYRFKDTNTIMHYELALFHGADYLSKDPLLKAEILWSIGTAHLNSGNRKKALQYLEQSVDFCEESFGKMHLHTSDAYSALARYHTRVKDYDEAIRLYHESLSIRVNVLDDDQLEVAHLYGRISLLYKNQDKPKAALENARKSLDIYVRDLGDTHHSIVHIYHLLQACYLKAGSTQIADLYGWRAEAVVYRSKHANHPELENLYKKISDSYIQQGDCQNSLDHYNLYLDQLNEIEIPEYQQLNHIGNCFVERSLFSEARDCFNRSLEYSLDIKDHKTDFRSDCYYALAHSYEVQQDYVNSYLYLQQGLHSLMNESNQVARLKDWGAHNIEHGDYAGALQYYFTLLNRQKKNKRIPKTDIAHTYNQISDCYALQGQEKTALNYLQKSLKLLAPSFKTDDYSVNPPNEDLVSCLSALEALHQKAILFDQLSMDKVAFANCQQAVDMIDQLRMDLSSEIIQQELTEHSLDIYETGIELAHRLHQQTNDPFYIEEAFNFAEKSKSYLLLEALKKTEKPSPISKLPDDIAAKEKCLNSKIDFFDNKYKIALRKKDKALIAHFDQALQQSRTDYQELADQYQTYYQRNDAPTANLEQIRKELVDPNTAVIEFFSGKDKLYTFTITDEEVLLHTASQQKNLDETVQQFRTFLATQTDKVIQPYNSFVSSGYAIYQQIVEPVLNSLDPSINKLVIVPDGSLSFCSFETLLTNAVPFIDDARQARYDKLPYLIKDYAINYAYSASHLLTTTKIAKRQNYVNGECLFFAPFTSPEDETIALSGDFSELRNNYGPLPYSKRELQALVSKVDGKYFVGTQATEEHFKKQTKEEHYSVIHISTHGKVADDPLFSNLLFTDEATLATKEDNQLHIYELYNLNLNADLVVLSACSTGYGHYSPGEGMLSIGRAFMYAGSTSMVMSLWEVNDKTTSKLMTHFYDALYAGMDKDRALQTAKINYLNNADPIGSHPSYWAAFIPVGSSRPIVDERIANTQIITP